MHEVALPPFAPPMLDSMRAIGYSFEAAIADILTTASPPAPRASTSSFVSNLGPTSRSLTRARVCRPTRYSKPCAMVGSGPHQSRSIATIQSPRSKKNRSLLENLEGWLRSYNAGQDGRVDVPLLH
jgi:hypothetical protein